jgi:hypothetical protein
MLHKERDWAAHFTHSLAQYADRPAAALSDNFPFKSSENPNMSACFWVRFKSFGIFPIPRTTIFSKADCFTFGCIYNRPQFTVFHNHWYTGAPTKSEIEIINEVSPRFGFVTGRWYHIGISVEGISGKIYVQIWDDFLRQIVVAQDDHQDIAIPVTPFRFGEGNFIVGNDPSEDGAFFDGYLDELVLFNEIRSPLEMDAIRLGKYNGQLDGVAVTESALKVGYHKQYKVTVQSTSLLVGYNQAPVRRVDSTGLMIGFILEPVPKIPPPPVIGGLAGGGAGEGTIDFCHLSYKFKTDVYAYDYGSSQEGRFETYTYPTRHLEASLGSSDQGAYFHIMSVLRSGAAIFSAPIWALRSTIVEHARAGQTVLMVDDASNYSPGENMIVMRANDTEIFDLVTISSIQGNALYTSSPLIHHYHPFRMPSVTQRYDERSSYIAPCMTGIVDIEDHGLHGPRPTFFVKVKVDGGAWPGAQIPIEYPPFDEVPLRAAYIAPRIEKTVAGTEDGILQIMAHFPTARLAFEVEWSFIDSKWKLLRELFLFAKGRSRPFYLPTWVFELTALQDAAQGDTIISLDPTYVQLLSRFPMLYFLSGRNADRFVVTVTGDEPNYPAGIEHWNLDHGGTGYDVGDIITPTQTGGSGATFRVTSVQTGTRDQGRILAMVLVTPGKGYQVANNVTTTVVPGGGMGCKIDITYITLDATGYTCEPLEKAIYAGDRACFYPQVRFLEDDLIFEFLDIGKCASKVSFIEVLI